jgi:MGT family glycosyltransferase
MSNFLIVSSPQSGHFNPATAIVKNLVSQGHSVGWYTGSRYQAKVEALGARFYPMKSAPDFDENDINATFPGRMKYNGVAQLKWDIRNIFIEPTVGQLADLTEIVREFPADVILADPTMLGALYMKEKFGVPLAVYGILPLTLLSPDSPPTGLGLQPGTSTLGHLRDRFLNWMAVQILFKDEQAFYQEVRSRVGLPAQDFFFMDATAHLSDLYLQGTTTAFEYPHDSLPSQVHFVGPLLPQRSNHFTPPVWWDELHSGRPVVLVTQGVIALDYDHLITPAMQALKDEEVLVVVVTGGKPVESLNHRPWPSNVRVERFIPFHEILPHVDVMVTNGGYGGTQFALAHGVPLVAAGISEGKTDICARIAWAGVGINLHTEKPEPAQIREAVRKVLTDPSYKEHAQAIEADYAGHDGPAEAAALLEKLASQPVLQAAG